MRLGLSLGTGDPDSAALVREAEQLGYSVVWAAEAYGSDAATVLAWVAAQTSRIGLGSAVFQIPARSAAMTAMTAASLDQLSGGRFRLGLGVSGPQVSEGWHGVRFADPLGRTREYVEVVRMALRRERVAYQGRHLELPLPDGPGKALRLSVAPVRSPVPLYLAALGPRSLELAGELADGALTVFSSPDSLAAAAAHIRAGRIRAGRVREQPPDLPGSFPGGFDLATATPLVVAADLAAAVDAVRGRAAHYVGGMGSREQNFYADQVARMGFASAAAEIQDRYLAGDRAGAAAAVPPELVDATSLLGPPARIADRLAAFADAGVGTLSVAPHGRDLAERLAALGTAAEALGAAGVGG